MRIHISQQVLKVESFASFERAQNTFSKKKYFTLWQPIIFPSIVYVMKLPLEDLQYLY